MIIWCSYIYERHAYIHIVFEYNYIFIYCEPCSYMFPTEECGSPIPIERPTLTEMESVEKAVCYSMCAQRVSSYVHKLRSV